jgi:hypothetical protein
MTIYKNLSTPVMHNPHNGATYSATTAYVICGIFIRRQDNGTWVVKLGWYELLVGRRELRVRKSWTHPWIKREMARLLGR